MKLVGHTQSGTLLIEMSDQEWIALHNAAPQSETRVALAGMDAQKRAAWASEFRHGLNSLCLPSRVHNALVRFGIGPIAKGLAAAIEEDRKWTEARRNHRKNGGYSDWGDISVTWNQEQFAIAARLVSVDGVLLNFADWISLAPQKISDLLAVRNLGKIGVQQLLQAIASHDHKNGAV